MKQLLINILLVLFGLISLYGQVGIDTTDPQAQLDIRSSNQATPSNTDGILIPKVDNFPATNPTASQDGMLIFVTGSGTPTKGFYYWNQGTTSWTSLGGVSTDADWFLESTTNAPTNINDDIYTLGNVAIGRNTAQYPLHIDSDINNDVIRIEQTHNLNGAKTGFRYTNASTGTGQHVAISNTLSGSGTGGRTGVYNSINGTSDSQDYYGISNYIAGSGFGERYGSFQQISGSGNGEHYGTYNNMIANGSGDKYGTYNTATSGTGDKYGSYNRISAVYDGTHYGVYSDILKPGSFAGYFLGNVSIGTTNSNNYILPASRGTNGQVMQTDGAGSVNWVDASTTDDDSINNLSDGRSDDDGSDNGSSIFLGIGAGQNDNQSNNASIGIGLNALQTATNSFANIAIGNSALQNFSGNNNIGLGYQAMSRFTSGDNNIILGNNIYGAAGSGNSNVIIGNDVGTTLSVGSDNTFIGYGSGFGPGGTLRPTLNGCVFIGRYAGINESNSQRLHINNSNIGLPLIYGEFDNDLLRVNGTLDINNSYRFPVSDGTANQVMQTDGAGNVLWVDPSSFDIDNINNLSDGKTNSAGNSTFLGIDSGQNDTQANGNNTGLGYQSLFTNQTGINNVALGFEAMNLNTQGSFNVAIGFEALRNNDSGASVLYHGDYNTAVGGGAGSSNTLGDENVFVGYRSGSSNTTGRFNTVIGSNAALNATTGGSNVYIGEGSARFKNGNNNTQVGTFSGSAATGNNNVYMGYTTGQNSTGSGNVFLGYQAGRNDNTSNRLIIENSSSSTPLIGGNFSLNRVGINRPIASLANTFEVGGSASKATAGSWLANSDRRLKKNIKDISGKSALDKLMRLNGISYLWNDNKTGIERPSHIQYGFIAQNIQEVFPEKVTKDALGYLQTAYGDYDAFFVEAIKELKNQLDKKDAEIADLKKQLKKLNNIEARLEAIESRFQN